MFTQFDAISFIAWVVFVYWQLTNTGSFSSRTWYEESRTRVPCAPPGLTFPIMWGAVLYPMLVATGFIFTRMGNQTAWTYEAAILTLFVNIMLNKAWSVAFFDMAKKAAYVTIGVLLIVSCVVTAVFMGLDQTYTIWWLPVVFLSIYGAWLVYALYLSIRWPGRTRSMRK